MDQEQLEKKIEWLEKEQRSDKQTISTLQKRLTDLEELLENSNTYVKDLNDEVIRMGVRITKVDGFDEALSLHRTELKKEVDAQDRRTKAREKYSKQKAEDQLNDLSTGIAEVRKDFQEISQLRTDLIKNKEEDISRGKAIEELSQSPSEEGLFCVQKALKSCLRIKFSSDFATQLTNPRQQFPCG